MDSLAMAVAAENSVRRARATQANFPALIRTEHLQSALDNPRQWMEGSLQTYIHRRDAR
jgi:hypothetical protein